MLIGNCVGSSIISFKIIKSLNIEEMTMMMAMMMTRMTMLKPLESKKHACL